MENLTVQNIAAACGGEICGSVPAGEVTAVVTDSRKIIPGCLFAAIRGERADGNDYVNQALGGGALCALAERLPDEGGVKGCVVLVPDTTAALQKIAGFYRAQFDIPVVGVTGSVGKTTAKEMAAAVLARKFSVHKTAGNFNNDLGVPLTLFGLDEAHTAAVVELGVSHPGDMARIAAIARPSSALYTTIGDAHLEFLKSREGVLREKSVMNDYLPEDGFVVCSGDDPLLAAMTCKQRKITYGLGKGCDVRAERVETLPSGGTRCVIAAGERRFPVEIGAFGEHMVSAALAAAALGIELGRSDAEIAAGIADFVPMPGRARLFKTARLTVIDDCYNANPSSVASALRSLSAMPGQKTAILGDMLELGERSAALHREAGALARERGVDLVLTTGGEAERIAEGAGEIGRHFSDKAELIEALPSLLKPGGAVLVKASRGARFEEIVEALEQI